MAVDEAFRWVATYEVGKMPNGDVGIQFSSSTHIDQAQAKKWDTHLFAMPAETARSLATLMLAAIGDIPPPTKPSKH